jgi:hypothetical protein
LKLVAIHLRHTAILPASTIKAGGNTLQAASLEKNVNPTATFFKGDVLAVLEKLSKAKYDLIVTSPPYNIRKIYERSAKLTFEQYIEWLDSVIGALSWTIRQTLASRTLDGKVTRSGPLVGHGTGCRAMDRLAAMKPMRRQRPTLGMGLMMANAIGVVVGVCGYYGVLIWRYFFD